MLSVAAVQGAAQAAHYFEKDDYYRQDAEGPAQWWGKAAEAAGLTGSIDRIQFQDALAGQLPNNVVLGTERNGEWQHKPGWDLTFSAPKSVSIMAEVAGDPRLIAAHDKAVQATLAHVEATLAHTRIRAGGQVILTQTGTLAVALFRHDMNRNQEPQLHTHAVVLNATLDRCGTWRSIESRPIFQHQKETGILYRQFLAAEVTRLGYEIVPAKDLTFEIKGVSQELIAAFSSRAREVEQRLHAQGLTRETATPAQAEAAAVRTRSAKTAVDREQIAVHWRSHVGPVLSQLTALHEQARARAAAMPEPPAAVSRDAVLAVSRTIAILSERQAAFSADGLTATATRLAFGKASPDAVQAAIASFESLGKLVPRTVVEPTLTTGRDTKLPGYTTPEAIKSEERLLAVVARGRNTYLPLLRADTAEAVIARAEAAAGETGYGWTADQRAATRGLLAAEDRVIAVQGFAGTAKTTTVLAIYAGAARGRGFAVIALAPTNQAAAELGRALGSEAKTIHQHLADLAAAAAAPRTALQQLSSLFMGPPHQVWIVDEASMAGTNKLADLLQAAEQQNARVVLAGDLRQLPSVEAGRPFAQVQEHGIRTFRLEEIVRQTSAEGRAAVRAVLDKDAGRAIDLIRASGGRVHESRDRDERIHLIANTYVGLGAAERARTLVIDPSREGKEQTNLTIRTMLRLTGELAGPEARGERLIANGLSDAEKQLASSYQPGDIVHFARRYGRTAETRIAKNSYLAVQATDHASNSVTLLRSDGTTVLWHPERWGSKSAEVFEARPLALQAGDRVRWESRDPARDLRRGDLGTVATAAGAAVTLRLDRGVDVTLDLTQRRDQTLDYGYTATAYGAQGATVARTIFHAESARINLINQASFYVGISRHKDEAIIVTDDRSRLIAAIETRAGLKASALDGAELARIAQEATAAQGPRHVPNPALAEIGGIDRPRQPEASPEPSPAPAPTPQRPRDRGLEL